MNGTPLHILQKITTHSIYRYSSSVKKLFEYVLTAPSQIIMYAISKRHPCAILISRRIITVKDVSLFSLYVFMTELTFHHWLYWKLLKCQFRCSRWWKVLVGVTTFGDVWYGLSRFFSFSITYIFHSHPKNTNPRSVSCTGVEKIHAGNNHYDASILWRFPC